ncbi:TonB-dependent receptor [Parvularcula bermudensis HTCC2503]|uniref:TonB-dependent receptor n=1 Tax=Parvularcula bermudensis (strain ATCC BAA-594 / HTCC2503 / KCTC 12087) TaxID=314260 RepID=E0TIG5_PARBH|nr:TonB-dependent receptor [Parvularcula bermudensis]ADM10284.1 TonB-dependent receptor [Parvularcula bermudensis HTCC2503]
MKSLSLGLPAVLLSVSGIALAQSGETDDRIIVTGSPLAHELDEVHVGTSVLTDEELRRRQAQSLGETLRSLPGVSATAFGPGASRPIIRGQGGSRVRVLENGVATIDAASLSPDHAVPLNPALADRIEVVRGTTLLRYGSNASGGVVLVDDGRLPSEVPTDGLEGAFRLGGSTVDNGVEAAGGITGTLGTIGPVTLVGHLSGAILDTEDYDIPGFAESARLRALEEEEEGEDHDDDHDDDHDHEHEDEGRDVLANSDVLSETAAIGFSAIGDNGFLAVSAKSFSSTYGIPAGHAHDHEHEEEHGDEEEEEHDHEEEEAGVFIELEQQRVDLRGSLSLTGPFEQVDLFAGYTDYEHIEFEGPGEPGTVFATTGSDLRLEVLQRERNGWRGAIGLNVDQRQESAVGEEAFFPEADTLQWGLYTVQEWIRGASTVEAGLRVEQTDIDADGGESRDFDTVSVSGSYGYQFTDQLSAGLTAFRTERAPAAEELFSDGPHLATGAYELGNPLLDIEVAAGLEAVLRYATDRFTLTASSFFTDYQDFIYERSTGENAETLLLARGVEAEEAEEFGDLPVLAFTGADARFSGGELAIDLGLGTLGGLDLSASLVGQIVEAELANGDPLPRIPPAQVLFGLEAAREGLSLRAELDHAAEQDETAEGELPTDSYTVLNAFADWTPFSGNEALTVSAAMLNLTDEEVRLHTSYLKDEVPMPGRNLRLSVRYVF